LQGISTFLVTNAQFPDAIRDMSPCTQLYVSIGDYSISYPAFPQFLRISSLQSLDPYSLDTDPFQAFRFILIPDPYSIQLLE
jgi:hypothetical protein